MKLFYLLLFSLLTTCQQSLIQTQNISFPNLSELVEADDDNNGDYIIIDPNTSFQCYDCNACEEHVRPIDHDNIPSSNNDTRPECPTLSWNELINKRVSGTNIKYVLLKPGDYRCLGRFFVNGKSFPSVDGNQQPKEINILYYNDKAQGDNRFLPERNPSDQQVIMEGIYLNRGSNNWRFHGLVFDGIGRSDDVPTRSASIPTQYCNENLPYPSQAGFGSVIDRSHKIQIINCVFQNHLSGGIRLVNSNNNIIHDCVIRNQINPIASDRAGIYLTAINKGSKTTTNNIISNNIIYNFNDGIQIGKIEGEHAGGTLIQDNIIFVDETYWTKNTQCGQVYRSSFENAIDIKLGGAADNPIKITGNKIYGFRPALNSKCKEKAFGQGITIHRKSRHIHITDNTIFDCNVGLQLTSGGFKGAVNYDYDGILIENNLFQDIKNDNSINECNKTQYVKAGSAMVTILNIDPSSATQDPDNIKLRIRNNVFQNVDKTIHVKKFNPALPLQFSITDNSYKLNQAHTKQMKHKGSIHYGIVDSEFPCKNKVIQDLECKGKKASCSNNTEDSNLNYPYPSKWQNDLNILEQYPYTRKAKRCPK